jgi:hypothetical protein
VIAALDVARELDIATILLCGARADGHQLVVHAPMNTIEAALVR